MGTGITRSVLRTVGGKAGDWAADKIDNVLGPAGKSSSKVSRETGQEDEYNPETARIEETKRINESLRDYTRSLEPVADKFERDCLNTCRENINLLVEDIKKINVQDYNGKKLNININRLERKLQSVEKNVIGKIKNELSRKVSIDDSECLNILKMKKGQAKENAMKEFSNRVFSNSLVELSETIRETVNEQCSLITDQIEDRLEEITNSLQEISMQFDEIEQLKEKDAEVLEQKKCDLYFTLSICDMVLSELHQQPREKVTV
ncbi:hypothetical protein [Lysinibacillus antri]|uniref:Uncharacterized protein n=1 Tax=Lysinibacillus antri TaxID=2498145 RepID=A0A3S0QNS3_9BACI|nr:hypothetical protein [Lysinibacillus antri]RUL49886.1 hypothetical protein EK386_14520 [Lysinibacillus antri]